MLADGTTPILHKGVVSTSWPFRYSILETPGSRNSDVIYYLHGGGGDENEILTGPILQLRQEWAEKGHDFPRVIGISFGPIWLLAPHNRSQKSGLLNDFIDKVMPFTESQLVNGRPGNRHLIGYSMGGFNALELVLFAPKKFKDALIISPALLDLSPFANDSEIKSFVKRTGTHEYRDSTGSGVRELLEIVSHYFPTQEDFQSSAPFGLLSGIKRGVKVPPILISAGIGDKMFYEGTREFSHLAIKSGIDATWLSLPGMHGAVDIERFGHFLMGTKSCINIFRP